MTAIARMAMLNVRTVAPYRFQNLLVFVLGVALFANKPVVLVPALVFFFTTQFAPYPFNVADKAGLDTLYAVLPIRRRSVLFGHYAWAVALFAVTVTVSAVLAVILARVQSVSFSGQTLATALPLSWVLFAVNVGIQFPLLIRFGYTRVSVLGTALPLAFVMGIVYKLHVTISSIQNWLPVLWIAGVAALAVSVVVATTVDERRMRNGGSVTAPRNRRSAPA